MSGGGPLAGRAALVTGASRGIGRAIAERLARDGATVAVHYGQRADDAETVLRTIEAAGGRGFVVGADLAETASVPTLVAALDEGLAAAGHARLDILVANAGIAGGGTIGDATEAAFDRIFAVNVKAPFFLAQALLPRLADGGRIVAISSMVSIEAYPPSLVYAMSKAAVNSFVRSLAVELGPRGITVNAVAPGATDTDLLARLRGDAALMRGFAEAAALKRMGEPDDIARVVAFLCGADGGWVTGQLIQASGGMNL